MSSNQSLLSVRPSIKGGEASATCRDHAMEVVTAGSEQQRSAELSKEGEITGSLLRSVEVSGSREVVTGRPRSAEWSSVVDPSR